MAVTMQQVLAQIDKDEPDYERAAKLGKGALPHLHQILEADDAMLASKAAYLAGLIGGPGGVDVLDKAAARREPIVRIAAADALRHTDAATPALVEKLLGDHDPGVRKLALRSAGHLRMAEVKDKVATIAKRDPEKFLRTVATDTQKKLK
jgi:HEAT repeat protein